MTRMLYWMDVPKSGYMIECAACIYCNGCYGGGVAAFPRSARRFAFILHCIALLLFYCIGLSIALRCILSPAKCIVLYSGARCIAFSLRGSLHGIYIYIYIYGTCIAVHWDVAFFFFFLQLGRIHPCWYLYCISHVKQLIRDQNAPWALNNITKYCGGCG